MNAQEHMAIESPHRLMLASAGSGKTFQLTSVFLRQLIHGEDPSGLLATTFTRAAAGEILHRALARLSSAVIDEDALSELRINVCKDLTAQQCAETLERAVGAMHRLSSLTIDAFFVRLLQSFSFELGMAPGWRLLDDEEDELAQAQAVDQTLEHAPIESALALLRDLQGDEMRLHAHQTMMDAVQQGHSAYLETLHNPAVWAAIKPIGTLLDDAELAAARNAIAAIAIPTTQKGDPRKNWLNGVANAQIYIDNSDWESFVNLTLVSRIIAGEPVFDRAFIDDAHRAVFNPLIDHARRVLTTAHARRTVALRDLLERFDARYTSVKRALSGVTHDDPPRLLLEKETTGDLEHLFFRLDAQIRHVLLDEFQDTSMMQFRLFEPILDELLSQATDGRSVFCVGDVKQSLYVWRQAEPTLLPALPVRWPSLVEEPLDKSWRSSPAVLEAVNAIFTGMERNTALRSKCAALEAAKVWDKTFHKHEAAHQDLSGAARLTVADEPDSDVKMNVSAANHAALETCVKRVVTATQQAPAASIAVLVRRGADVHAVLRLLKRAGVDASEKRGNPLVDAPSVAVAASMLRLIEHPGHTAALRHVATSPLGRVVGLTDPHDTPGARLVAAQLRERVVTNGCADLLAAWFVACAESMDARGAARFAQFIELAESFDAARRSGPADLAAIAETRRLDEPGRAPVRVMTIHGSKGLEFDVVVVPLVGGMAWRVNPGNVIMARDDPLGPVTRVTRYPNETMRLLHPDLAAMHDHALKRNVNEELCCLYVAATRAKRCLEIVVPADKNGRKDEPLAKTDWRLHPAHVVRAALAPDAPACPGATLWSKQTADDWTADLDRDADAAPQASGRVVTLRTRPSRRRSAARLASASPSQERTSELIAAVSLLAQSNGVARTTGELIHHWFEQIEWLDDGAPDDAALRKVATRAGFPEVFVNESLTLFRSAIEREPICAALTERVWLARTPGVDDARVHRERPFAVRDAGAQGDRLLRGRFDRLVEGRAKGEVVCAEIFDFKTDHAAEGLTGEALEIYAAKHRAQMEAYRRAAARMFGLPDANVAVTLLFTAPGDTVTLPSA